MKEIRDLVLGDQVTQEQMGSMLVDRLSLMETESSVFLDQDVIMRRCDYVGGYQVYYLCFASEPDIWIVVRTVNFNTCGL